MSNTELWEKLGKTDPAHTKPFNRAGGFKGTAIKPIWIIQKLTELFGPVGIGWGMNAPTFETVHAQDGEVLVYCTVACWHGKRDNVFFGVGGDKVVAKRSSGHFADDEAFKKAFTDAVNNAFKFLGVGADVHMGQFDDSKYVEAVAREYQEEANDGGYCGPKGGKMKLKAEADAFYHDLRGCGDQDMLTALLASSEIQALKERLMNEWPGYLNGQGMPSDFEPINRLVKRLKAELPTTEQLQAAE